MSTDVLLSITDGPSREGIFANLEAQFGEQDESPEPVTFTVMRQEVNGKPVDLGSFEAQIIGLDYEDGSGQSFILRIYPDRSGNENAMTANFDRSTNSGPLTIYFQSRKRQGGFQLTFE